MDPDYGGKARGLKYSYSMKRHMDPDYGGKVRGLKYSYSMKRHMDPDSGGKVRGLKYSYSMKRHMDPDYGGKVRGLKYSYSMKRHMDPDYGGKVRGLKYSYSMKGHVDAIGWLALSWMVLSMAGCGWLAGWLWLNPPTPGPKPRGPHKRGKWEGATFGFSAWCPGFAVCLPVFCLLALLDPSGCFWAFPGFLGASRCF